LTSASNISRVPIEEALKFGWDTTLKNFWPLLGMMLVAQLPMIVFNVVSVAAKDHPIIVALTGLPAMVVTLIFGLGLRHVFLKVARGESFSFGDILSMAGRVLNAFAAAIIFVVVVGIGFLLFFVPGVMLALKLQFFTWFIIDKNMGPIAALKASWEVTTGEKLQLFLLYLAFGVIGTIGLFALFIGIIPASMIILVAEAFVYQRLINTAPASALLPSGPAR